MMLLNFKKKVYFYYLLLVVFFVNKGEKTWKLVQMMSGKSYNDWSRDLIFHTARRVALEKDLAHASFRTLPFFYGLVSANDRHRVEEKIVELLPVEIDDAKNGRESSNGRGYNYLVLLSCLPRRTWREYGLSPLFKDITDEQIEIFNESLNFMVLLGGGFYTKTITEINSRKDLHL